MIRDAIDKIIELVRPETVEIDGRIYSTGGLCAMKQPAPQPINVHTLTGIVDWIKSEQPESPIIHVCNERLIRCIGKIRKQWSDREVYLEATPFQMEPFAFKQTLSIENFIIDMQSKFIESPDRRRVIDFLSSIRGQEVTTADDDGIAQQVTTSNKIGRLENTKMNPIVTLFPYRTFLEIEQPQSKFLLRLHPSGKNLPMVALYETDGGAWKYEAFEKIASWFRNNDFIKENSIDIIA